MREKRRNAIVVDFDNTLFFTDMCAIRAAKEITQKKMSIKSIRLLPKIEKHKIYRLGFAKYYKGAKPNTNMVKRLVRLSKTRPSDALILLSAKPNADKNRVKYLIDSQGISFDSFVFRPKKYLFDHDEEWKLVEIGKLLKKYNAIDIYEDKIDNIKHIAKKLSPANMNYFLVSKNSIRHISKLPIETTGFNRDIKSVDM
jgi:hypothetical protein